VGIVKNDTKPTDKWKKNKVEQIELEWNKAIEKNDVESMGKFMSDDWMIFSGDGNITTKQMFLELVKKGDLTHTEMDFEISSTVFLRRNDQWLAVQTMIAPATKL
jgi:ketosteroid isomerase-like protein